MADRAFEHQIDVLSGAAEQRLQEEKLNMSLERARRKQLPLLRLQARAKMENQQGRLLPTIAALTDHERRRYSLKNLISALSGFGHDPGLEHEISASISKDMQTVPAHGGVWVPFRLGPQMSGLDTKTNASGEYLVAGKVSRDIVDQLRAATAVLRLGATFMGGIRSNFSLPIENAVLTGNWVSQDPGSDVPASDPSLGVRTLTGHAVQATTSVSRQLLQQSTPNVESWIGSRLAKAHGQLLDKVAIHGTGTLNQPLGIVNTAEIGNVAVGVNGGALTNAHVIALESAIADANADSGSLAWLTNSTQRAKLRKVGQLDSAYSTFPVWDDSTMLGYPAEVSNQVRSDLTKGTSSNCSALVFGAWDTLIVAEFGGAMEIVFDEFSQKKQGMIELTSFAYYDIALTTLASFAAVLDAI